MKRALAWILAAGFLAVLVECSIRLAGTRVYDADECINVWMAKVLASGQGGAAHNPVSIFFFPLMWIARGAERSVDLFVSARFFALELFWLNVILLAVGTGAKLLKPSGLLALAAAATLSPLWNYGLEIRPDILILAGLLLMWCVLRVRPEGAQSFVFAGFLAATLQFVAMHSLVYTIPLSLAALVFPAPAHKAARWKLALAWIGGVAVAVLALRIGYGAAGLWSVYLENGGNPLAVEKDNPLGPWQHLARLMEHTPLV